MRTVTVETEAGNTIRVTRKLADRYYVPRGGKITANEDGTTPAKTPAKTKTPPTEQES